MLAGLLKKETIDHINLLACATGRKQEIEKLQALQIEKEQGFSSQFAIMG